MSESNHRPPLMVTLKPQDELPPSNYLAAAIKHLPRPGPGVPAQDTCRRRRGSGAAAGEQITAGQVGTPEGCPDPE